MVALDYETTQHLVVCKVEPTVQVWETLANIEGDTEFVDAQFQPGEEGLPQVKQGHGILLQGFGQGEDGDRALALALGRQEEQGREREQVVKLVKVDMGGSRLVF